MLVTLGEQRQVREGECVKRGPFRAGQGHEAGEEPQETARNTRLSGSRAVTGLSAKAWRQRQRAVVGHG